MHTMMTVAHLRAQKLQQLVDKIKIIDN